MSKGSTTALTMSKYMDLSITERKELQNKESLRERLANFMVEHNAAAEQIAKEINRKASSVAAYARGTFTGDDAEMEARLGDFLRKHEGEISSSAGTGFLPLSSSRIIWETAQFCSERREMGAIIAPAGFSKTKTAQEWVRKHGEQAALITASVNKQSLGALFGALSHEIGGRVYGLANDQKMDVLVERIKNSPCRLILIDEAQFLPWTQHETLKDLHDQAGIGILYVGTGRLLEELRGRKGHSWDQITSRIGIYRRLETVEREDIEKLGESILPGLSKSSISFIYDIARGPGKLRTAAKLLSRAKEAQEQGIEINTTVLKEISGLLLI